MSEQVLSPTDATPPPRRARDRALERLSRAFAVEQRDGRRLAVKGRTFALIAVMVLLVFVNPWPAVLYFHGLLVVFILLGYAEFGLYCSRLHRTWHDYAFAAANFALLTYTLLVPNPLIDFSYPPQLAFRFGNFIYFFLLLMGLAFSYLPRVVLWGGLFGAAAWAAGVGWMLTLPGTSFLPGPDLTNADAAIDAILRPEFADLGVRLQEIVVFLIVAALLAVIVTRARSLVWRQAAAERERANLARYFAPTMVDRLAQTESPLSQVREQPVAVLFADIVGFTEWAEPRRPTEVIGLLCQVHARLEQAVFEHGGTLDKFVGDGVMATFGTPEPGPRDTANGLACVHAILADFQRWNADRAAAGESEVRIVLGLHYGAVVVGDIGTERRLELAVLGDTVNVASRLERLTRDLDCHAVVSDAVIQALPGDADTAALVGPLTQAVPQRLRGRSEMVAVWTA